MLFPFPGAARKLNASNLEFIPLATTGDKTGTVNYSDPMERNPYGSAENPDARRTPTGENYVLAAHIRGKVGLPPSADELEKLKAEGPAGEK